MKIRPKRLIIWGVVIGVLVLLALPKLPSSQSSSEAQGQPARGPGGGGPTQVDAVVLEPEVVRETFVTTGTLRPGEEVELRSETSGRITGLYFQEGRAVSRGALLVKINDNELQAQLRRATERLSLATAQETRQERLVGVGAIAEAELESKTAERRVLETERELIREQIRQTEIRAPFSGVIGLRSTSVGAYVTPSSPIATLQSINPITVEFSVPERYSGRVGQGSTLTFRVEGREEEYQATVYAAESEIEAGTRTRRVRARTGNPNGALLPGAFARVTLEFGQEADALTVPAIALVPVQGGQQVYVVREGRAQPQRVETGVRLEDRVQITSGLSPRDTVVTSGLQAIRPGAPVRVNVVRTAPEGTVSPLAAE